MNTNTQVPLTTDERDQVVSLLRQLNGPRHIVAIMLATVTPNGRKCVRFTWGDNTKNLLGAINFAETMRCAELEFPNTVQYSPDKVELRNDKGAVFTVHMKDGVWEATLEVEFPCDSNQLSDADKQKLMDSMGDVIGRVDIIPDEFEDIYVDGTKGLLFHSSGLMDADGFLYLSGYVKALEGKGFKRKELAPNSWRIEMQDENGNSFSAYLSRLDKWKTVLRLRKDWIRSE